MKRLLLSILLSLAVFSLPAQSPSALQGTEKSAAITKILNANSLEKPMRFDFKMTRHNQMMAQDLVSTGNAAMSFPDKILWKVSSPYASEFIMNGQYIRTGAKTIDISTNRRYQTIARNLSGIKTRGLINETDFKVSVYSANGNYQVDMVPVRRDLAQMFSLITLVADAKTGTVSSIILSEVGGDSTVIKLSNLSHSGVEDSLFKVQ